MKHQIIDLVVAVDQCTSIPGLCGRVSEECHRILKVWDVAHRFFCLNVDGLCLRDGYRAKGLELAIVES